MSRKWSISRNQFWPRVTNLPRHFSSRHLRVLWSPQSIFNDFDIKQSLMFLSRGDFYHPWHTFAVLLLWSGKWGRGWRRLLSRHQDLRLGAGPGHGGPLIREGVKREGTEKSFGWNIKSHNPLIRILLYSKYCQKNILQIRPSFTNKRKEINVWTSSYASVCVLHFRLNWYGIANTEILDDHLPATELIW